MSKRQKERKRKEKRNKIILKLILFFGIAIFLAAGIYIVYSKFFAKKQIETFFPTDSSSFLLVKINYEAGQEDILKKLGLKFGDENFFQDYLENLIFPGLKGQNLNISDEKVFGWRGDYAALGKIKVSDVEDTSIFVIEAKNPPLAQEFLKILEENLGKRGYDISSENFRDTNITTSRGLNKISYAIYGQYLLISEKPDGVKKMIDTARERFPSLDEEREYRTAKNKLEDDKFVVFAYFDPTELIKSIPIIDKQYLQSIEKYGLYESDVRMGISFIPHEDNIEAKLYSKKSYHGKSNKSISKLNFAKIIPSDLIFYYEGKDFKSLVENLFTGNISDGNDPETEIAAIKKLLQIETGIDLDNDLFEYLQEDYAAYMLPSSDNKKIDIVLLFNINDQSGFSEKLGGIEDAIIKQFNKSSYEEAKDRNFTDHSYQNLTYRYLNLPDKWVADISYGLTSDYFFIATSEKAAKNAIDVISSRIPDSLSDNNSFKTSYNLSKNKDSDQFFFGDFQNFIKFLNHYIDFEYESLDKKIKILESVNLIKEEKRRENYHTLFLKIQ